MLEKAILIQATVLSKKVNFLNCRLPVTSTTEQNKLMPEKEVLLLLTRSDDKLLDGL